MTDPADYSFLTQPEMAQLLLARDKQIEDLGSKAKADSDRYMVVIRDLEDRLASKTIALEETESVLDEAVVIIYDVLNEAVDANVCHAYQARIRQHVPELWHMLQLLAQANGPEDGHE